MKFTLALAVVVLLCVISSIEAVPTVTEKPSKPEASQKVKDAIEQAKKKKNCAKVCTAEYKPICAHDPTDASFKPLSFGSQCVLEGYNCENNKKLVMKNAGECPGSQGVRLS